MKTLCFFLALSASSSPLWALPATLEDNAYKVVLSETLPGLDGQLAPQTPATITALVQDKVRLVQTTYPLVAYAIPLYFLDQDNLDLLCRVNPKDSPEGWRFSFIQISLSNPPDSRQFTPIKRYSFSPDDRSLLAVFDGGSSEDAIGVVEFSDAPARMGWLYANNGSVDLFSKVRPSMAQGLTLNDPAGWSADSRTVLFVATASDETLDGLGKPILKDYLVRLDLSGGQLQVAADPVDLSAYHFRSGGVLTRILCGATTATLYFNQNNVADQAPLEVPLPKFPAAP